jgi:hypothetical protein
MSGNRGRWRLLLGLLLGLLLPSVAQAGPFFGDWGWLWHRPHDCDRGVYSPAHYWAPSWYYARAHFHPSNLDQYPPGPFPPVPATFAFQRYRCPSTPPAPSSPYADPTGFYGRPVAPP